MPPLFDHFYNVPVALIACLNVSPTRIARFCAPQPVNASHWAPRVSKVAPLDQARVAQINRVQSVACLPCTSCWAGRRQSLLLACLPGPTSMNDSLSMTEADQMRCQSSIRCMLSIMEPLCLVSPAQGKVGIAIIHAWARWMSPTICQLEGLNALTALAVHARSALLQLPHMSDCSCVSMLLWLGSLGNTVHPACRKCSAESRNTTSLTMSY
jgi:hypothetical protein